MSQLPKTDEALYQFEADRSLGYGEHRSGIVAPESQGQIVGHRPFDPRRDLVPQIDLMAIDLYGDTSVSMGQVREVRALRPLSIDIVTDYTAAGLEDLSVTEARRQVAADISFAIESALPGMMDRARQIAVGSPAPLNLPFGTEVVASHDPTEVVAQAGRCAASGLVFVISDFANVRFEDRLPGDVVGIKVNHPFDRELPSGIGIVSLGGLDEANTGNKKDLNRINDRLAAQHQAIIGGLERVGIATASLVATPAADYEYRVDLADEEIAAALDRLRSNH